MDADMVKYNSWWSFLLYRIRVMGSRESGVDSRGSQHLVMPGYEAT